MPGPSGARIDRALQIALIALSIAGLLTLLLSVADRVGFPFPLEWMEGASLQHALRLLHGQPLYAAPSAEFIPYLYPPLAYVPMAASVAWVGPTLVAARLPSVAFTLLSLLLVGRMSARAAQHPLAGLFASGLFAMGFGYTGAFLDLARVDACFVALLLLGAERLQAGRARSALAWLALSAFTKQHGLLLLLGASAGLLWQDRRRHGPEVTFALAAVAIAYTGLDVASDGWLGRYCFALPLSHRMGKRLLLSFFFVDVLVYLPVLALAAAADVLRRRPRIGAENVLLFSALVASALGRAHVGGWDNVRLPAFALLCVAGSAPLCRAVLATDAVLQRRLLATAALALQLAMLWQAPSLHRPRPRSNARFTALRDGLRACADGGRAVALDYGLLTQVPFVHTMALSDLRLGRDRGLAAEGTDTLLQALRSPDAPAAIAVGEHFPALDRVLEQRYHECTRLPAPDLATGYSPGRADGHRSVQVVYAR
ncbi:MAG: hypothetical protein ACHQ53_08635 [Polyangiales bacterium]